MPKDEWLKANRKSKSRRGFFNRSGAGPTGPVAKPLGRERPAVRKCPCGQCARKGSDLCRPCAKRASPAKKPKEPSTAVSLEVLRQMHHVIKEIVRLNGLGYNSPEYSLLGAVSAMMGNWPRVNRLTFDDVRGRYLRMLERLDER